MRIPQVVLVLGLLLFAAGVARYFGLHWPWEKAGPFSSLTERNLAVDQAQKEGKKEYNFSTNFIPGIGVLPNGTPTPSPTSSPN